MPSEPKAKRSSPLTRSRSKSSLSTRIFPWFRSCCQSSFKVMNGSLSDFEFQPEPAVWEEVRSEQHVCTQKTCAKNPRCFYQAMRRRVSGAHMVVLNHALFFTLLGGAVDFEERGHGVLFAKDFVILDEA